MNSVFEEGSIGKIKLNNRILRAATFEGMADNEGRPTERYLEKYIPLAKGGVGAIITGYAGIMQNGKSPNKGMAMINDERFLDDFKKITEEVHKYNTPIILQLNHCGRQTRKAVTKMDIAAPSAIKDDFYTDDMPKELTVEEIKIIENNFIKGIVNAKKAGYDGVELHAAHGFLLSEFLSNHANKREDRYGGSLENRFRIIKEILKGARENVGDFTIIVKINGYETVEDGLSTDDSVKLAMMLEKSGCDAVEVSCDFITRFSTVRGQVPADAFLKYNFKGKRVPKEMQDVFKKKFIENAKSPEPLENYNVDAAKKIKEAVNIPVIVLGGIKKYHDIENIITKKEIDFVSMCRPLIIEPDLVNKFKYKKSLESKCAACNNCLMAVECETLRCFRSVN